MKGIVRLTKDELYRIGQIRAQLNTFEHYIYGEAVFEAHIVYNKLGKKDGK